MIGSTLVWINANTLTHDWEPSSTQQSLTLCEDGRILVVPNYQPQIETSPQLSSQQMAILRESAPYQELMLLITHCKAVADETKKISAQLKNLPNTNLAEYQDKMSQYQGVINLLHKHARFLQTCHDSLIRKERKDLHTKYNFLHKLSFELLEEESEKSIEALHKMLTVLRANQKRSAVESTFSLLSLFLPLTGTTGIAIQTTVPMIMPTAFTIGSYAYQEQNYKVTISLSLKEVDDWNKAETIHPAHNQLVLRSASTDTNNITAEIKFSVNWGNSHFPLIDSDIDQNTIKDVFEPDYLSLFKNQTKITSIASIIITSEKQKSDDRIHLDKLKQALVEWMVHFNIEQIVTYDMPAKAPIYYGEGFSCDFRDALPKSVPYIEHYLNAQLKAQSRPAQFSSEENQEDANHSILPYIIRNRDLALVETYKFEAGLKKSYAKLMTEEPVLNPRLCGTMPELMGIPRLPFCNLFETLRKRELTGRSTRPNPIAVQAAKLDYRDLENPNARRECSQISEDVLREEKIHVSSRTIVKVRRSK